MLATVQKIKGWEYECLNFLLAVRITHWIYLTGVLAWFFFSYAFLTPLELGWVPYTLFCNALVVGYLLGVHIRYWINRIDKARIID